jgi:hypothetical protein
MDFRVQLDALIDAVMPLAEEGINITRLMVDHENGSLTITVGGMNKGHDDGRGIGQYEGQRDALANLDNAAVYARIMKVLDDNGINNEGGLHSWRCFDKERYPIPCSCAGEVVVEILAAIKGGSDD